MKTRLILFVALVTPLPLCAAPAKKPTKVVKKAPVLVWPRISRASQGDAWDRIGALQKLLNARGAHLKNDGEFGAATESAIKKFQRAHGIKADGVVGPQTWPKLIVRLKRGDKGQAVSALQSAMIGHDGEYLEEFKKEAGVFGFETEKAVRDYQKNALIKGDGVAGPQTWCILMGGEVK